MASNSNSSNTINVPEARQALYNMKHEVANELGIDLKKGYNGDLTSRDAGSIGGTMVKKMIEAQEKSMSNQ
ncbi:MAG: alpha/beta-type small acid-soluble spore protein [Clostridia bacterium]|nr:alpha/beta-type small acid-soluble spore protein [Clostridia bacterium]